MTYARVLTQLIGLFLAYTPFVFPRPLPLSETLSISQFGAKGDGRTDDTKAFREAFAWQAKHGGHLQLAAHTYLLTGALTISDNLKPLSISGGEGTTLLFAPMMALDNAIILSHGSTIELRSFTIRGEAAGLHHALSVFYSTNVRLDHLHIDNVRGPGSSAIAGLVLGFDNRIWVTHSEFTTVGSGGDEPAFAIWNYYRMHSENIYIEHNYIHDSAVHIAIGMFDTNNASLTDNTIDGNNTCILRCNNNGYGVLFYRVDFHGLPPDRAPKLLNETITGNHISNTAGSAIYLAAVDKAYVADNTITRSPRRMDDSSLPGAAIALNGADNIAIISNVILDDGKGGICLATTNNVLIQGNQIRNSPKWGIHLRVNNAGTTIKNNVIDGAPVGLMVEYDATFLNLINNVDTRVTQPVRHNGPY